MALDRFFMYKLLCMYAFLLIGLWWVLYSEDEDEYGALVPVDYRPVWVVALIGLFASFSIMQGAGSVNSEIDDDAKGRAAMDMIKLFI